MFKNCTFNINILSDDKHQQEDVKSEFDGYVKFDRFGSPFPTIESLLDELSLSDGADYLWDCRDDECGYSAWDLWVLPTCFGQVYDAIHSSAGVDKKLLATIHISSALGIEDNDTLTEAIYEELSKHKAIHVEMDRSDKVYIYKVNQNAN